MTILLSFTMGCPQKTETRGDENPTKKMHLHQVATGVTTETLKET